MVAVVVVLLEDCESAREEICRLLWFCSFLSLFLQCLLLWLGRSSKKISQDDGDDDDNGSSQLSFGFGSCEVFLFLLRFQWIYLAGQKPDQ